MVTVTVTVMVTVTVRVLGGAGWGPLTSLTVFLKAEVPGAPCCCAVPT